MYAFPIRRRFFQDKFSVNDNIFLDALMGTDIVFFMFHLPLSAALIGRKIHFWFPQGTQWWNNWYLNYWVKCCNLLYIFSCRTRVARKMIPCCLHGPEGPFFVVSTTVCTLPVCRTRPCLGELPGHMNAFPILWTDAKNWFYRRVERSPNIRYFYLPCLTFFQCVESKFIRLVGDIGVKFQFGFWIGPKISCFLSR